MSTTKETPFESDAEDVNSSGDTAVATAVIDKATSSTVVLAVSGFPYVADLPVPVLAAMFQRMPPVLKRQVEMTNHAMASLMKAEGWRMWRGIEIVDQGGAYGVECNFRVNDSIDVSLNDLVDCVLLLLSRVRTQSFAISCGTHWNVQEDVVVTLGKVLAALVKHKEEGGKIKQLRLNVPSTLLEDEEHKDDIGEAVRAYSDSVTHLGVPLNDVTIAAIKECHQLEQLECSLSGFSTLSQGKLKEALLDKESLKALFLNPFDLRPVECLTEGVHRLRHLTVLKLSMLDEVTKPFVAAADVHPLASALSELRIMEVGGFFRPGELGDTLRLMCLLDMAPQLERFHVVGPHEVYFSADATSPVGDVAEVLREVADKCLRNRHCLTFTCRFALPPTEDDNEPEAAGASADAAEAAGIVGAADDVYPPNMLFTMMKYDSDVVNSPLLAHYQIFAYDARLHAYDANLTPPLVEVEMNPLEIRSIDGSSAYKRVFRIELGSNVRLCVAFDESPAEVIDDDEFNDLDSDMMLEVIHDNLDFDSDEDHWQDMNVFGDVDSDPDYHQGVNPHFDPEVYDVDDDYY